MIDILPRLAESATALSAACQAWTAHGGRWAAEGKALGIVAGRIREAIDEIERLRGATPSEEPPASS